MIFYNFGVLSDLIELGVLSADTPRRVSSDGRVVLLDSDLLSYKPEQHVERTVSELGLVRMVYEDALRELEKAEWDVFEF